MPYILEHARERLESVAFLRPETAGELNYCVTILAKQYAERVEGYTGINEAIGALECAKLELYRRLAAPYEDKKIIENGDVYA